MKIYFAGSIRGGRDDREFYRGIIALLQKRGVVLTEHIGEEILSSVGEITRADEEIFSRDVSWIKEAGVVVAEVTNPSLGVGYELGFAESLGKSVICLFREGERKLSAMISGNKNFSVFTYEILDDLDPVFDSVFCVSGEVE